MRGIISGGFCIAIKATNNPWMQHFLRSNICCSEMCNCVVPEYMTPIFYTQCEEKTKLNSNRTSPFKIHVVFFSVVHSFWFRRKMRIKVGSVKALQYLKQIGAKVLQSF